jgi:hypothetical protein
MVGYDLYWYGRMRRVNQNFLEPLSILTKYKTSETPKIDNIFIYLRFDYISVIIRIQFILMALMMTEI